MDLRRRYLGRQDFQQIGPVNVEMWGAETAVLERHPEQRLSRHPIAPDTRFRLEPTLAQCMLQPQRMQNLDRICADPDTGADLTERARLFEHMGLDTEARKRRGGSQAAKAASYQSNAQIAAHGCLGSPQTTAISVSACRRSISRSTPFWHAAPRWRPRTRRRYCHARSTRPPPDDGRSRGRRQPHGHRRKCDPVAWE